MKNSVIVVIPSHPKYLCLVRDISTKLGELNNFEDSMTEKIKHAVDEACSNIMKHAYGGDTNKKIKINYTIRKNTFEILIDDDGKKVRPASVKGRRLDEIRPGGLGTHIIGRAFDKIQFDKKKKGNRLRLIKYLKGE
jgi:anti-sigma regulatory factor (Ser/Thr protein kinase)